MILDNRIVQQILAHLCSCDVPEESKEVLNKVLYFAQKSHRADDLGILNKETL